MYMWKRDWKYLIPILYPLKYWNFSEYIKRSFWDGYTKNSFRISRRFHSVGALFTLLYGNFHKTACGIISSSSLRFWEAHRIIQTNYKFQILLFRQDNPAGTQPHIIYCNTCNSSSSFRIWTKQFFLHLDFKF